MTLPLSNGVDQSINDRPTPMFPANVVNHFVAETWPPVHRAGRAGGGRGSQPFLTVHRGAIHAAVIPGEPRKRRDPGRMYPGIRNKARQGYLGPGSRAGWRSAGMTAERVATASR